jgi:undecaprenyl-diphosphatase
VTTPSTAPPSAIAPVNPQQRVICRVIFAILLALNFFSSWHYLTHDCPIDLSGDEAQYWDWSRNLDLAYYSKGPMVAYIIRASCALLGNTMPAVRLPALILTIGTSICTYWLTRKLFGSEKLALGAILLSAIIPMYTAGGMLMTIDPPLFFFWALATCLAAVAIFDHRKWAWPAAGIIAGLGVLTKYVMLLWPPFILLFLLLDRDTKPKIKTNGPWMMTGICLLSLIPVIIWNARHNWVSLHHVAGQTGTDSTGGLSRGNLPEFVGSQIAAINPFVAVLMIGAIAYCLRSSSARHPHRRQMRFLLAVGGSLLVICLLDALVTKVQVNWPAPAYFTLLILTACFISTRWKCNWKPWRGWFYAAIVFGIAIQPPLHDLTLLYPAAQWINRAFPRKNGKDGEPRTWLKPAALDMEHKLRGIADPFASTVSAELHQLPPGAFILCEDYMDASQLAFYAAGQPRTYFAGSYWTQIERDGIPIRRRWTQFDIWPDRQLDRPELIGKDAIYIGTMADAPLRESFDSVQRLPDITVYVRGLAIRSWTVWRCRGFKGMHRPPGEGPR